MAGSSTSVSYDLQGPVKRVIIDWVSDNSTGAVSVTLDKTISGRLIKGITNPGAAAPSPNYDIAITDEESVDVLGHCIAASSLANRHTSNTEEVYFFLLNADGTPLSMAAFPVVCGLLTIAITNAGNSKAGRLILYVDGVILGDFSS